MSREDEVFSLLVESNPIPDLGDLDLVDAAAPEYLATLERRSSGMASVDTQTRTSAADQHRRNWLWAAAVAVIVIGVGGLVVSQRGGDPASAPLTAQSVADTFVSSLEALDSEAVAGIVTQDATTTYLETFGYEETQPGSIRGLWEWGAIYGSTYTFDEGCRASDNVGGSPPSDGRTFFTCDYQLENDWTQALGQPAMSGRFRMEVSNGQITWLVDDYPSEEWPWGEVIDWVQTNHPEDFDTMFLDPPASAKLTPESMGLWQQYTPQITESLSGS